MLDCFFDLLAWFIPREAACDAATPRVPNPPRLLAFPDAEEGDCDELGEDGISANGLFPEDDFNDFFDEVVFELELDDWAGDVADDDWEFKFPYAAYNAVECIMQCSLKNIFYWNLKNYIYIYTKF